MFFDLISNQFVIAAEGANFSNMTIQSSLFIRIIYCLHQKVGKAIA